ncbi:NAD-dependent epimerase/dehydratase family protein [Methylobacter luteus]|uniref:NAD-dependent epimerase/dehydratase family protein n=1 Tax=Methylobacter luteus TaxID=415 RepID=UPI0003F9F2AF|nr:NAD-dependent epimerase/dehydratase family protein [Methylobacter luteus]
MSILVTGVTGFIGSNFVLDWLYQNNKPVTNLDNLIYTCNMANINSHIYEYSSRANGKPYSAQITFVRNRLDLNSRRAILSASWCA